MVSTHGYVAAIPPLGAADTGGQVVYVIELSKKLAQLGYEVDIWTRQFEDQAEIDPINEQVRIIRARVRRTQISFPRNICTRNCRNGAKTPCASSKNTSLIINFINSHYWDAGVAGQRLSDVLDVPHLHTPHSLGIWKKKQMEADYPGDEKKFEKQYNFSNRIRHERLLYADCDMVVATTPQQLDLLQHDYEVPEEKCRMIPPGYDDNRFFPVSEPSRKGIRQRLGFAGKMVLAIGRLARNKGYDLLINGFQLVAQRDPEADLAAGGRRHRHGQTWSRRY